METRMYVELFKFMCKSKLNGHSKRKRLSLMIKCQFIVERQ